MRNPEPAGRRATQRRRRLLLIAALLAAGCAGAAAEPPSSANAASTVTERMAQAPKRTTPAPKSTPRRRQARHPAAKRAAPAKTARELRVSSDVAGAMVFLDRKYLGTTPLVFRDVTAGPHQLNVQVEGATPRRPGHRGRGVGSH